MSKRGVYLQIEDGARFEIDLKKSELLRLACCDCGLVHDIAFAVEKNGKLGIAMRRNQRATAGRREGDDKKVIELMRELMARASDDDYRFIYKMALLAFLCDRHGFVKVMNLLDEQNKR